MNFINRQRLRTTRIASPLRGQARVSSTSTRKQNLFTQICSPKKTRQVIKPLHTICNASTRKYSSTQPVDHCINHKKRVAMFTVTVSGSIMKYCENCAAHLATNGFKIQQIPKKSQNKQVRFDLQEDDRRYQIIDQYLGAIKGIQYRLKSNFEVLIDLQKHYKQQQFFVEEFYNGMILFVSNIKAQHLKTLRQQSKQSKEISTKQIKKNQALFLKISEQIEDVETQIQEIVINLSQNVFTDSFKKLYKQIDEYKAKLKTQEDFILSITNLDWKQLQNKQKQFKRSVQDILGVQKKSGLCNSEREFSFDNLGYNENVGSHAPDQSPTFKII